jgi:hypothetical protein
MEEETEITHENWFCFELEHSEVYVSKDNKYSYAQKIDGDDEDEDIVLENDTGVLFEGEIELFGSDTLTRELFEKYLEFRKR